MVQSISDDVTTVILQFLEEINIPVSMGEVTEDTFLPGILVSWGELIIDKNKLQYPGDILHEAGHLAIAPSQTRSKLYKDVSKDPGDELATMAWTWAALKYLEIPPEIVFHPGGFKGDSEWLIEMFGSGGEMGVPLLQWMGLTTARSKADKKGASPFPAMRKWLRD